jgi:hypothetical protein
MPIKSCSRCGLKVLVDASQAAADNFVCARCAPDQTQAAPPPRPAGGKRPSIKVTCPYCGASFSGSMPSRPAKGGCPVCQKELVLLPDGTIQAAATFNLASWQKEREAKKSAPAPVESPPELPSVVDPLGGATILDMGGPSPGSMPSPAPSLEEPSMPSLEGIGGETMLGMGHDLPPSSPAPTIDEAPPAPLELPTNDEPEAPPDLLGGATILDMGPRPVETPPSDIEEPAPDLISETMPGMDRPPAAESPVEPPIPPPIPEEPALDEADVPTLREPEPEPEPELEPEPEPEPEPVPEPEPEPAIPVTEEPYPASLESAPEIPADLGGQTILGLGGAEEMPPRQEPAPSIEEPPPEAVPILAKDVPGVEPEAAAPAAEDGIKSYEYKPIPRVPRTPPPPVSTAASVPPPRTTPSSPAPQAPISAGPAPLLGSDFRIASAPPPPPPSKVSEDKPREERKPAGPKTSAVVMPRAYHSLGKLIFAWTLLLLAPATVFALHTMKKNGGVEGFLQKVTNQAKPGIDKMRMEIEKAVKKEEPPK